MKSCWKIAFREPENGKEKAQLFIGMGLI